jgi:cation transport regulator ChaB
MPTTSEDLPSTIARSPKKVQRAYSEALDGAHETYGGDEERAHRTAFAAVKHIAEKRGDRWQLKDSPSPSDPQSAQGGAAARDRPKRTYGGVDAGKPKSELYEQAKQAGISGRSNMTKDELAKALARHNDRETAKARR